MNLLVVSQYFWPENFRINDLVNDLTAKGHAVTVLTGVPNYPEGRVFPAFQEDPSAFARLGSAEVVRVPMLPRGRGPLRLALNYLTFALSGCLWGPWRLRGRAFDGIFVFEVSPITMAFPAILLRWIKRAPLFLWVLDLWPDSLAAVGAVRSPRILSMVGGLVRFIYRRCDRILVQSRAFIPNVESHGAAPGQIRYFPQWAEDIFSARLEEVDPAPELAPYGDTFNILFAGNIGAAQDFPAILDAAAALSEREGVRWLIVGDGREAEAVRTQIQTRGLEDRVKMLGRHPLERMPSFFRGAQALLVSLRKDPAFSATIPGKVQSYLASGIPVLGMLDGEGARIIEEAGAGLAAPAGDGPALADCVRKLVAMSSEERRAMGCRGREFGIREFDRQTLVNALLQWFRETPRPGPKPSTGRAKGDAL